MAQTPTLDLWWQWVYLPYLAWSTKMFYIVDIKPQVCLHWTFSSTARCSIEHLQWEMTDLLSWVCPRINSVMKRKSQMTEHASSCQTRDLGWDIWAPFNLYACSPLSAAFSYSYQHLRAGMKHLKASQGRNLTVSPSLRRTAPFACLPICPVSSVSCRWNFEVEI